MKKLVLLFLGIAFCIAGIAQNRLYLNLQTGQSVVFKTGSSLRNLADDDLYIGNFSWDKKSYTVASLGATYETPTLKVFKHEWYLMTELNLNYRNYGKNFYNILSISNDLYFPVIKKPQKLRFYLGIRNILVISDFVGTEVRVDYPINNYVYGSLILLNYQLANKLKIGLNLYADLKPPIMRRIIEDANYQTLEIAFKVSYLFNE